MNIFYILSIIIHNHGVDISVYSSYSQKTLTGNISINAPDGAQHRFDDMKLDTIDDIFTSLSQNASALNSFSDNCNQKLKSVQDRLVSLNIGLEYWLKKPLVTSDQQGDIGVNDNSTVIEKRLGFSRINGNWMLAVKTVRCVSGFYLGQEDCHFTNEYVDYSPEPLLDASREIRLNAVKELPTFLSEYNELVSEFNSALE